MSSDMEELKENMARLQTDVASIREETTHAHRRIDSISNSIVEMKGDVAKVAACVGPLCKNVDAITEAIIGSAFVNKRDDGSNNNKEVMIQIIHVVKYLILASIAIGCLSVAGYYGLKASGKSGQTEITVEKQ